MRNVLVLAAAAALAASVPGYAQQVTLTPDQVIAARQAGMDLTSGNVAAMKAANEAKADVKPLTGSAKALASWGRAYPALFPDGTQTGHNTKAKPEIWSDRAGFEKAAADFVAAADKLAQLADANDKAGFATQYTAVTQTCGGCHRNYRAR